MTQHFHQKLFCCFAGLLMLVCTQIASAYDLASRSPLKVCVIEENFPFSERQPSDHGLDVDMLAELGKVLMVSVEPIWIMPAARGGINKTLKQSVLAGQCDLAMGVPERDGSLNDLQALGLITSKPYLTLGYLMVSLRKSSWNSPADLRKAGHIGAVLSTPADLYLKAQNLNRYPYPGNQALLQSLKTRELDVALVWAAALAFDDKSPFPDEALYQSVPLSNTELQTRFVIAANKRDEPLLAKVSQLIEAMATDGRLKQLVEKYHLSVFTSN
ncbi:substrate-binding periplasmic protein [Ampullimonas aquatilis]|uniref:substrate-binding periplasmic protein n=1 Tax=Ampullimonas aquatilis TaxID=1341549 RepID=UPI003C7068F7